MKAAVNAIKSKSSRLPDFEKDEGHINREGKQLLHNIDEIQYHINRYKKYKEIHEELKKELKDKRESKS